MKPKQKRLFVAKQRRQAEEASKAEAAKIAEQKKAEKKAKEKAKEKAAPAPQAMPEPVEEKPSKTKKVRTKRKSYFDSDE